ncbi:MAG: flagellar biosynthesis regulator FlaF [Litoreibacter sp.]|uniref:flagellar biosynthesis regulator FlaF n=1 Tax=Litoreibacter sp. TaxID=1969459 RepID=UPI003297F9EE
MVFAPLTMLGKMMNATLQAASAYGVNSRAFKTNRGIEIEILTKITRDIMNLSQERRDNFPHLVSVLHKNRQLWTALAIDVSSSENALTKEIRASIFYLSEFVNAHTKKVLSGKATTEALSEVNISIMRGLSSDGPAS